MAELLPSHQRSPPSWSSASPLGPRPLPLPPRDRGMQAPRAPHPPALIRVPLVVKCVTADGRTKRLQFVSLANVTYAALRSRVASSLQFHDDWSVTGATPPGTPGGGRAVFDLTYTDDDGEVCDVGSQEDLMDALAYFSPSLVWQAIQHPGSVPPAELGGTPIVEVRLQARMRLNFSLSDWGTDGDSASIRTHSTISSYVGSSYSGSSPYGDVDERYHFSLPWAPPRQGVSPLPSSTPDNASLASERRRVRFSAEIERNDLDDSENDWGSSSGRVPAPISPAPSKLPLDLGPAPVIRPSPWGRLNNPLPQPPHSEEIGSGGVNEFFLDEGLSQLDHRSDFASSMGSGRAASLRSTRSLLTQASSLRAFSISGYARRDLSTSVAVHTHHDTSSGDESDDTVSHKSLLRRRESASSIISPPPLPPAHPGLFARLPASDAAFLLVCQRPPPSSSGTVSTASTTVHQPESYTCSACRVPLGGNKGFGLRYVCGVCGPRREGHSHDSSAHPSPTPSVLSVALRGRSSPAPSDRALLAGEVQGEQGLELCAACISIQGPDHVASRAPPRSHAFYELMWNPTVRAWLPVEHDPAGTCASCGSSSWRGGQFRCSQCACYALCGLCFRMVSTLHAPHLFTRLPLPLPPALPKREGVPKREGPSGSETPRASTLTDAVHTGVACASCGQYPIVGVRVHCVSCAGGRDFCSVCDERGLSFQPTRQGDRTYLPPHTQQHICLKITLPIDRRNVQTTAGLLEEASDRLVQLALRGPVPPAPVRPEPAPRPPPELPARRPVPPPPADAQPIAPVVQGLEPGAPPPFPGHPHQAQTAMPASPLLSVHLELAPGTSGRPRMLMAPQCGWCGASFAGGVRYLCSRCPVEQTGGFSLCQACEPYSLLLHDPRHVFLKINRSHSTTSLVRPPYIPPLYDTSAVVPSVDSPLAESVWDKVLSISGHPSADSLHELDQLLHQLDPDHPLRAKAQRIRLLRYQLQEALRASRDHVPPSLSMPGSQETAPGPVRTSSTAYPPRRMLERDDTDATLTAGSSGQAAVGRPGDVLSNVVDALLGELNLVPPNQLVHAFIVCDSCFEVIEGAWLRCGTCTASVDLCARCELRADHDASHALAVFKQSVDNELVTSLVALPRSKDRAQAQAGRAHAPTKPILGSLFD